MNRDIVLRFLHSIGRPAESEFYIRLFSERDGGRFAVLAVSHSVATELSDALVADLGFLATLGLRPVVLLGLDAPQAAQGHADVLASRLDATQCALENVAEANADNIVIAAATSADESERFAGLQRLVNAIRCEKLVFVGRGSGLQKSDGTVPALVNLHRDYQALSRDGALRPGQTLLLSRIRALFAATTHHLTVAVTSPFDLIRELFTVRGAGTLIRQGAEITCLRSTAEVDTEKLADLLSRAFGKVPRGELFHREVGRIYVAGDYRGAAMVGDAPMASYLSKFAVDVSARGEGLGSDLWQAVTADAQTLLWRSSPDNPIANWYAKVCHGMHRDDGWHVFWRGLSPHAIPAAIDFALRAPVDFQASASV